MPIAIYLTHPQVAIDPAVPVPDWGLSAIGRARTQQFSHHPVLTGVGRIVSSEERKAIETATLLGNALGLAIDTRPDLHENDRAATGFLPPAEFEATADRFFAEPETSVRGWERAIDAQARIHRAVVAALAERPDIERTLFVGHGGVGTLLMTLCGHLGIGRLHDQSAGGGNWFTFDAITLELLRSWHPMELDPPEPWVTPG